MDAPEAVMALDASFSLELAAAFLAGLVLGLFHFRTLHRVSEDYLDGHASRAIALQLLRLAVLAGALVGLALLGAGFLLAGTLGVLIARFVVMRRVERDQ
jgi:F1F0 ATPase subunit 2